MTLSKNQRSSLSLLLLTLIVFLDSQITYEVNSTLFYLLPIGLFAYNSQYKKSQLLFFAITITVLAVLVDFTTHAYFNEANFFINTLNRLVVFVFATAVFNGFYIEREQKQIIAEQKKQLESANNQLEQANTELNKFIGVAAHDIRNPIGSIKMMAEILAENQHLPDKDKNFVNLILHAANSSLQILGDTLNVSQIQSGTITLQYKESDFVAFVKENLQLNEHLAVKKRQKISLLTTHEKMNASFDQIRLSQVLNNLITNAIKYSDFDTAITIKVSYTSDEQHTIITHIIDQGLGIDEKFHARLFDPFVMTSNIPTANESKTGLGLAIVKKIVELHKGKIDFTSEKGKGSDFFFTLPVNNV